MNLDYLRTFREVVEAGNFSEVARKLSISQPAVSFQIQKLEHELGVRLIDRGQKRVTLTEAGKRLLRFAETVSRERENLLLDIDQLREEIVGNLVIAASTIPGNYILPNLLSEFKALHPAVTIQVTVSDSGTVIDRVVNRAFEMGFCGIPPESRELTSFEIAEDEIVLVAFPEHPMASRQEISVTELLEEPMVLREEPSGTRQTVELRLLDAGFDIRECKPALILDTTESVITAVEARAGIAFVSNLAIKKSLAMGLIRVVPIKGIRLRRDFFCIYRQERIVSRLLGEFLAFVRNKTA